MSNDSNRRQGRPGMGDLFERALGEDNRLFDQLDRNLRSLASSALDRLDVVSREEFDAQAAVLARTQARVAELEAELERLAQLLDSDGERPG